jgi:hypothetical protein
MSSYKKALTEGVELTLSRFSKLFFALSILIFVIFSGLLFDAKLFMMGDDADYLLDGYNFIHFNIYPAARSSLYGITVGLVMLCSGCNIIILKLFSLACAVTGFYLMYKIFRGRIPYWLLFATLYFTAVNSAILYYSSSNLSEAFFMMVQCVYFHAVFLLFQKQSVYQDVRKLLPYWCYAGFAGLLITLGKNVAIVAPFCLSLYFLLRKEYRNTVLSLSFFALFKIPYELLLRLIYGKNTIVSQFSSQILSKVMYHPERGHESIGGFIRRVDANAGIYLSGDMVEIFGLKYPVLHLPKFIAAVVITIITGYALWHSYRQNKWLFFSGIYLVVMMGVTFLAMHPDVAQSRLIIIYVPLTFCLLLYGAMHIGMRFLKNAGIILVTLVCCFCLVVNFTDSVGAARKSLPVLRKNISGNTFYGYTPDWINYLKMGQYVTQKLPDSVVVAARKPNSLMFYCNERQFMGLPPVQDNTTADMVLQQLAAWKLRYFILASLRYHPEKATGEIIYTLHGYIDLIREKYPEKVKTIHTIGKAEPCSLVEVMY